MTVESNQIEAVLFSAAKPLSLSMLERLFDVDELTLVKALETYKEELINQKRGIRLQVTAAGCELVSAPECAAFVEKIRKREDRLSSAAMETLAIIAFKQPVTKAEIEEVRGVNCDKVLKQLEARELVLTLGRKQTIGRPVLYGTTDTFLRSVGIESLDALKTEIKEKEHIHGTTGETAEIH